MGMNYLFMLFPGFEEKPLKKNHFWRLEIPEKSFWSGFWGFPLGSCFVLKRVDDFDLKKKPFLVVFWRFPGDFILF